MSRFKEFRGKCSWFGGPNDTGVDPDEGLAFIYEVDDAPHLFLSEQPPGTTGLARRLNPDGFYIACRWNYELTPKDKLLDMQVLVSSPKTGKQFLAYPADWGPHVDTDRIADLSPGLLNALGLETDDEVVVGVSNPHDAQLSVVISSGHGSKVPGASCFIDEVKEARKVTEAVAGYLKLLNVHVLTFHDDTSTTQSENLDTIVKFHNSKSRDLDVSVHFNAYEETSTSMGTECLYVTQNALAAEVSSAISRSGGLKDRGAKYRDNLAFLNGTSEPSILIEVCFVDSSFDVGQYKKKFNEICEAIAKAIAPPSTPVS